MVIEEFAAPENLEASSVAKAHAAIDSLDLSAIESLLQHPEPRGHGWGKEKSAQAIAEYKRFLKLVSKYPSKGIVPSRLVDQVWHAHILDTRKYAQDCDATLGYFLHHNPYRGLVDDEQAWRSAFDQTNVLYELEFGPTILPKPSPAGCDAADQLPAGCDAADQLPAGCDAADRLPAGCDAADRLAA